MKRVLACLALLVLAGCAQPVPTQQTSAIRTVGIVSALPDQFTMKHIGFMVFGNSEEKIPTRDWGVEDRIAALLSQRYEAKRVPVRRDSLRSEKVYIRTIGFASGRPIGEAVRDEAGAAGLDAYFVVTTIEQSQYGTTNRMVGGLGLVTNSGLAASRQESLPSALGAVGLL